MNPQSVFVHLRIEKKCVKVEEQGTSSMCTGIYWSSEQSQLKAQTEMRAQVQTT